VQESQKEPPKEEKRKQFYKNDRKVPNQQLKITKSVNPHNRPQMEDLKKLNQK
jgi:hypothetical protein